MLRLVANQTSRQTHIGTTYLADSFGRITAYQQGTQVVRAQLNTLTLFSLPRSTSHFPPFSFSLSLSRCTSHLPSFSTPLHSPSHTHSLSVLLSLPLTSFYISHNLPFPLSLLSLPSPSHSHSLTHYSLTPSLSPLSLPLSLSLSISLTHYSVIHHSLTPSLSLSHTIYLSHLKIILSLSVSVTLFLSHSRPFRLTSYLNQL